MTQTLENRLLNFMISRDVDFTKMPYYVFANYIKNPAIREEVIKGLNYDATAPREELDTWLEICEKDQYSAYASGKITFAQFRS